MKKIIYSFVIMIAAGSLFTSCVTNTEPQGIKDIREAKANYLDALAELRKADAAVRNADAEYRKAETALKQAEAALVEAAVKAAEIAVELEDAAVQAKIAEIKAQAEIAAVKAREDLAKAQDSLERTLRNLAAQSLELSTEEQEVITHYTTAYEEYLAAQKDVRVAEKNLYDTTYNYAGDNKVAVAKAKYEQDKALAEQSKAFWEEVLADAEEMSEEQIANYEEWVSKYEGLKAENDAFKYDLAEVDKGIALNDYENKAALDSFYAAIKAKQDAITKAGGKFTFKEFKSDLPVVSFKEGSVVETFVEYAKIKTVTISDDHKKITVAKAEGEDGQKVVKNVVDSLNIIIDALNREKVVVDQIVKDTTGIAALVAKTQHDYDSIKTVLEAGIDKFGGLADKQKAYENAKKEREEKEEQYKTDTAKLFAAINTFVKDWNTIQKENGGFLQSGRLQDSLTLFNDLKAIMVARKALFGQDTNFEYYAYDSLQDSVKISVPFSEIEFSGLVKKNYKAPYAGYWQPDEWGGYLSWDQNAIAVLFDAAFGTSDYFKNKMNHFNSSPAQLKQEISVADLKKAEYTNYFENTFFKKYWVGDKNEIFVSGVTGDNKYATAYVKAKKDAEDEALTAITTAKQDYYKGIYCTFWGLEKVGSIAETGIDSLKINFTEKTYTDPKVLVTFSGENVFTPAKDKKPAEITWANVHYNDTSVALKAIETQLGQNNIKIKEKGIDYTLYAKTLAVAQFAAASVNYKENTEALAELTKIVKAVETAYNDAVSAASAGTAKADSLKVKYLGKDKKYYGNADYTVNYSSKNITKFIFKDGKGTFNLAGEQKELAEKYLTAYAKTYSELEAERAEINVTIKDNNELCDIYDAYIKALAKLDEFKGRTPEQIFEAVQGYWYGYDTKDFWGRTVHVKGVLEKLQSNIAAAVTDIKTAEGNLAKLEAGYDPTQIDIESAQDNLARAQEALEVAEAKLAAAEAAYQQVLKNHGLAE